MESSIFKAQISVSILELHPSKPANGATIIDRRFMYSVDHLSLESLSSRADNLDARDAANSGRNPPTIIRTERFENFANDTIHFLTPKMTVLILYHLF